VGLDVFLTKKRAGGEEDDSCVQIKSAKYPNHLFEIGYWQSSYNEGGIDRVLESFSMPSLWHLSDRSGGASEGSAPLSWPERLVRAKAMLLEFKNAVNLAEGVRVSERRDFGTGLIVECGPDYYDWYIEALEIVVLTCEWVLSQENPEEYELVWIG